MTPFRVYIALAVVTMLTSIWLDGYCSPSADAESRLPIVMCALMGILWPVTWAITSVWATVVLLQQLQKAAIKRGLERVKRQEALREQEAEVDRILENLS